MARVNAIGNKKRIRTILFSAKVDSLFVRMDPLLKFTVWIMLSVAIVRAITEPFPDAVLGAFVLALAVTFLAESGTIKYLVKSYLVLVIAALGILFLWWILFNQVGTNTLFNVNIFGFVIKITGESVYIGFAKVLGYAAMAFMTILVLMTTRDSDAIKAMNELKVPFRIVFFLSLSLRSFNILAEDFETIKGAKFARGSKESMNPVNKAREFMALSIPLTVAMIRRSVEMGAALEARGFSNAKKVKNYERMHVGFYEIALVAFSVFVLVAANFINLTLLLGA